jgi:hypothetical protein
MVRIVGYGRMSKTVGIPFLAPQEMFQLLPLSPICDRAIFYQSFDPLSQLI